MDNWIKREQAQVEYAREIGERFRNRIVDLWKQYGEAVQEGDLDTQGMLEDEAFSLPIERHIRSRWIPHGTTELQPGQFSLTLSQGEGIFCRIFGEVEDDDMGTNAHLQVASAALPWEGNSDNLLWDNYHEETEDWTGALTWFVGQFYFGLN